MTNRDIYLGIVAFLGFLATIFFLPQIHPVSAWDELKSDEEVEEIATSFLLENGYSMENSDFVVKREVNTRLLHSVQSQMGRKEAIDYLKNGGRDDIPVFTWEVDLYRTIDDDRSRAYRMRFTPGGRLVSFEDDSDEMTPELRNPLALEKLETTEEEENVRRLILSQDSSNSSTIESLRIETPEIVGNRARSVVRYHLMRGSKSDIAELDSLKIPGKKGRGSALAYYTKQLESISHIVEYDLEVSSRSGVLHSMDYSAKHVVASEDSVLLTKSFLGIGPLGFTWSDFNHRFSQFHFGLALSILVILGLIFVIAFIKKLGAGLIDSKIALRLSIAVGVISFVGSMLTVLYSNQLGEFDSSFRLLLSIGGSAIQALIFGMLLFVVGGVTDSIARQVWPAKLKEMDLIWNGEIFNKVVGRSILRGLFAAGILLFVAVAFLWITNNPIHLNPGEGAYHDSRSSLSFFAGVSNTLWTSYFSIAVVFLGVCTFFYRKKRSRTRYMIVGTLMCVLISVAPYNVTGPGSSVFLLLCSGGILAWFYWQFGFLSAFLGHLIWYVSWMSTVQNTINDLDFPLVGVISGGLILALFGVGLIGLMRGKDEEEIRAYKPAYIDKLAKEQRMFRELEIARSVQSSFLPQEMPSIQGVQIAAICEAATEVGGDYFDLVELDNDKVAMVIGDVSGKGIQAAFYMTLVKGFVRSLCRSTDSPAELLRQVNALFHENSDRGTFISMIYGVLDTKKSTLTFARAGHNPLLLKRSPSQIAEVIQPAGLGLGLVTGEKFDSSIEELEINIRRGDVLVFYTDGFSEAMDLRNDLYTDERLTDLISHAGHKSASVILEEILEDVKSFVGEAEQNDDMTMIVVKLEEGIDNKNV